MISIIVAVARNGVIGDRNRLIWHISEDLRRFKAITTGHPVIMGRKTFESLGRPLPNRINVVVTRQTGYRAEGCVVAGSLEDAIRRFDPSEIDVTADMLVKGDRLMDLPLTEDELVVTVKRDDTFFIPNGRSKLYLNDKLMIISHSKKNPDTEVPDSNTPSEPAS